MTVPCSIFPRPDPDVEAAVLAGGGEIVPVSEAEALFHTGGGVAELDQILHENPAVRWIQLRGAGIDRFVPLLDPVRLWTSAKGAYSRPMAEHALALALAGMRGPIHYSPKTSWSGPYGQSLYGTEVVILGGGGIARHLIGLLQAFDAQITVVRRRSSPISGATVVGTVDLAAAVSTASLVVVALALTESTRGVVDSRLLADMPPHSWLVNVARGAHVVTPDLVDALEAGEIEGAALDVTDPEPLPPEHPLWSLPNVLITPHVGCPPWMAVPLYMERIRENLARYAAGEPLIGMVDVEHGY